MAAALEDSLDGARGAQFLGGLADLIEEPLALLV